MTAKKQSTGADRPVVPPPPAPEANPETDPDELLIPEEDPDIVPDEDPFETPPYEEPPAGEGP